MLRNGPKRTIFASGRLGLLQMVLEPNSEDVGPPSGVDCEIPHELERGNEVSLVRVWKFLPSRHVLEP